MIDLCQLLISQYLEVSLGLVVVQGRIEFWKHLWASHLNICLGIRWFVILRCCFYHRDLIITRVHAEIFYVHIVKDVLGIRFERLQIINLFLLLRLFSITGRLDLL